MDHYFLRSCNEIYRHGDIDVLGRCRFSDAHLFEKPNDEAALHLMNRAAQSVMDEISDVTLALGESDEYRYASYPFICICARAELIQLSFLIRKSSNLYNRRRR
jgi:tRNA(His) guanylyltransferase